MTATYDHSSYMETIATNLKELSHSLSHKAFVESSTIGLFDGLGENAGTVYYPCLVVIDDLTSGLEDRSSDNVVDVPYYQFAILCRGKVNDTASNRQARTSAKAIAKKVISRMFSDQRSYTNGLDNLNRASIRFQGVGPVGDGAYGCLVTFTLVEKSGIVYNAEDWIDG